MVSYETLLLNVENGVAVITVNRPDKRNSLNSAVRRELIEALDRLREDETARVVVITGAGDKAFIAGADIGEFAERTPVQQRAVMAERRIFDEIAEFPKPVIAMINGFALGGGCEVALACDLRIAGKSAKLGQPEIKLGIIPGGGGTQRLPRIVGVGTAMRLILTGELISAEEELHFKLGLQHQIDPASKWNPHNFFIDHHRVNPVTCICWRAIIK